MQKNSQLSPQCDKIYALLRTSGQALSAYEILDKMRVHGMRSPPTIYRALDQLQQAGLVHRIESLNAFTACQHSKTHDHDHMSSFAVCMNCKTVEEIHDIPHTVSRKINRFLKKIDHEVQEITGLCHSCSRKA